MEFLDVYDSDGEKTGKTLPRNGIFSLLGEEERVLLVHVCVFDANHRMLVQQRQFTKDRYPGCWDVSAGGFVTAGESPAQAALRELREEIGLTPASEDLITAFCEPFGKVLDWFFILFRDAKPEDFTLQESELAAVRWAEEKEILSMIEGGTFVDYSEDLIIRLFRASLRE